MPSPDAKLTSGGLNKPGAWSQSLMELGATVCTPKNPDCDSCPLTEECLAYAEVMSIPSALLEARQTETLTFGFI